MVKFPGLNVEIRDNGEMPHTVATVIGPKKHAKSIEDWFEGRRG